MLKIDSKIAELIGMHVGDGTLYKTNRCLVWELRGALSEKDYYDNNVAPLLLSIFNKKYAPKFRNGGKNGCYGVQISNNEVTSFFLKQGFTPGTKTYTVQIPKYIKQSSKRVKLAFLRGLFDTDGCLRFDKNSAKIYCYPKIEFGFASRQLIDDLTLLLNDLNFHYYTWNDANSKRLCIAGKIMLARWIAEVRPKNSKHLKKYENFQEMGYVLPYAGVAQPGTALT